ncbi:hypothetical protein T4A_2425 [Trichinella pseudospiralis]|uniref:Uncharacterized protein n=1 Tax=Trichinella pseudospiralis TaxID=6337 RepID=A0A0V1E6T7_TRIPS|nr:hypothetical protein T4A_2425 [Trichinella pseudospiralis]
MCNNVPPIALMLCDMSHAQCSAKWKLARVQHQRIHHCTRQKKIKFFLTSRKGVFRALPERDACGCEIVDMERSLQSQSERPISASKRGGGPVGKWHATGQRAVKKRVREQSGRKKKPANKRARSQAKKAQRLSSLRH